MFPVVVIHHLLSRFGCISLLTHVFVFLRFGHRLVHLSSIGLGVGHLFGSSAAFEGLLVPVLFSLFMCHPACHQQKPASDCHAQIKGANMYLTDWKEYMIPVTLFFGCCRIQRILSLVCCFCFCFDDKQVPF